VTRLLGPKMPHKIGQQCEGYETAKKRAEDRCLWWVSDMGVIDLLLQQNTRRRRRRSVQKCQNPQSSV